MMLRIAWQSFHTGFKSHGDWFEDQEWIHKYVECLNRKYRGIIKHEIEYLNG